MNINKLRVPKPVTITVLTAVLLASNATSAQQCSGLDEDNCIQASSCSWINSYERKDGRTVKAFCRAKPGTKQASSDQPSGTNNEPSSGAKDSSS